MIIPEPGGNVKEKYNPRPNTIVAVDEPMKNRVAIGPTLAKNSTLAPGLNFLRPGATTDKKRVAPPSHPIAAMM